MIGLGVTKKGGEDVVLVVYGAKIDVVFIAVMDIIIAYSGNVAFFGFIAELKHPETFPKALFMLQATAITIYLTTAVVVYYYVGDNIVSPALGSTGPLVRKIAYGIATPTILVAGVINGHVAIKYVYIRVWRKRNPNVITQKTFKARASWIAICAALWAVAWLLAEAIPSFNQLLALIGALFGSWFTCKFLYPHRITVLGPFVWERQKNSTADVCGAPCSWAQRLHVAELEQRQLHGIEEEDAGDGGECGDDHSGGGACKSEKSPSCLAFGFTWFGFR